MSDNSYRRMMLIQSIGLPMLHHTIEIAPGASGVAGMEQKIDEELFLAEFTRQLARLKEMDPVDREAALKSYSSCDAPEIDLLKSGTNNNPNRAMRRAEAAAKRKRR